MPPQAFDTTSRSAPIRFMIRTGSVICLSVYPSYLWNRPSIAITGNPPYDALLVSPGQTASAGESVGLMS